MNRWKLIVIAMTLVLVLSPSALAADSSSRCLQLYERSNFESALPACRKEAKNGNSDAQFILGLMYANGQGVGQNYSEAVRWYQKAAEQGLAIAQYNLGLEYAKGQNFKQDAARAVKWLSEAARQGDADSQYVLGLIYGGAIADLRNDTTAADWFYSAGITYLQEDNREGALRCFEQIKTLVALPKTTQLANKLKAAISGNSV